MTYVKQNWENLPSENTPISAERLSHLETQYDESLLEIRRTSPELSVKDFGAVGDGITDDTLAIQDTMDSLESRGGGVLLFPEGSYFVRGTVLLTDNVTLRGSGAEILKNSAAPSAVVFASLSNRGVGYGAGASNIVFENLTFRGVFGTSRKRLSISLHHSDNVYVRNCSFIMCSSGAHIFDLQGCSNILIDSNKFYGFDDDIPPSSYYAEDIQLDFSMRAGASYVETDLSRYDGLPTVNVTISKNWWLKYDDEGRIYPAANPVGSHALVEGMTIRNIKFIGNTVQGGVKDTSSAYYGRTHFWGVEEVTILGNSFDSEGNPNSAIRLYDATTEFPLSSVGTPGASTVPVPSGRPCRNFLIKGNSFKGFGVGGRVTSGFIYAYGSPGNIGNEGLSILGNVFDGGQVSPTNSGQEAIVVSGGDSVTISGNVIRRSVRAVGAYRVSNLRILSNSVDSVNNTSFIIQNSSGAVIGNNSLSGRTGSPFYGVTDCPGVVISGNSFLSESSGVAGIRVSGTSTATITGNTLSSQGVKTVRGVDLINSVNTSIVNNTFVNAGGIVVDESSTILVDQNNVSVGT